MTERIALHTRLKAGAEDAYDRVHATIPDQLDERLRRAGVRSWSIWRSGRDLFHLVEVDDHAVMRRLLADDPVNVAWQGRMAELLEVEDDYSEGSAGLPLVWRLPDE